MSPPGDEPVGYRVILLPPPAEKLDGLKAEPYEVNFPTEAEAVQYKREKQSQGWIASVVPVFLAPQTRGKMRKKGQARCAPPNFNSDWRLHAPTIKGG